MNSIQIVIEPPDISSVKRGTKNTTNTIKYTAAFRKEAAGKKPIHIGTPIWVNVVDEAGKVLRTDSCTIVVNDKGGGELEAALRRVTAVECSAEKE